MSGTDGTWEFTFTNNLTTGHYVNTSAGGKFTVAPTPPPPSSALRKAAERWGFAALFDEDHPDGRF